MLRPRARLAVPLIGLAVLLGGCSSTPAADDPSGAVRQAFTAIDDGDLDRLLALTCAAQQETTREQFGFAELGGSAGLDLTPIFAALKVDQSGLAVTTTGIQGDRASVHLGGTLAVSFDAAQLRDLFRQMAEQRGRPIDDASLDALIAGLQATTQALPVNETVDVAREDDAWKLCSRLTLIG